MILLSLILLLGISATPDLHSATEDSSQLTRAARAIDTLNQNFIVSDGLLAFSHFNEDGIRILSQNADNNAQEIARAILDKNMPGIGSGDGYYLAINGNNHSAGGFGQSWTTYPKTVAQLKKIKETDPHSTTGDGGSGYAEGHAAPISTPTPELMATTIPPAIPTPTTLPQPAPSHPAAGATSTTSGHTPPLNTASGATPAPSATVPPAHAHHQPTPTTPPTQPMAPQEAPLPQSNTGPQPTVPPTHPTPTPATPHTTQTGNTGEATGSRATLPQQPSQPVVQPPLTPPIRTRIPYTKTQKGAIGGGFLTTAAGLAWLFTLLAQKESREDIKLFWGKLFSKKTRAAVATRAARIRSEIKRHGNESIGALTTTLAGLGLLLYGGLPRYQKPTHPQAHGAEGTN
ncbi:MAG: hypothetical protein WCJ17_00740 [bacterium]